jgi:hypothetical protein
MRGRSTRLKRKVDNAESIDVLVEAEAVHCPQLEFADR